MVAVVLREAFIQKSPFPPLPPAPACPLNALIPRVVAALTCAVCAVCVAGCGLGSLGHCSRLEICLYRAVHGQTCRPWRPARADLRSAPTRVTARVGGRPRASVIAYSGQHTRRRAGLGGAQSSLISMVLTVTGSMGLSPSPVGTFSMARSTSMPSTTLPKTGCFEGVDGSK